MYDKRPRHLTDPAEWLLFKALWKSTLHILSSNKHRETFFEAGGVSSFQIGVAFNPTNSWGIWTLTLISDQHSRLFATFNCYVCLIAGNQGRGIQLIVFDFVQIENHRWKLFEEREAVSLRLWSHRHNTLSHWALLTQCVWNLGWRCFYMQFFYIL